MRIEEIYKPMTDLINDMQARGEDIIFYINKMGEDLAASEINSTSQDRLRLESQITVTYNLLSQRHNSYTSHVLKFVTILQRYITNNYTSVDSFLSDNKMKVKSVFAAISEGAGYPSLATNISDVS